MAILGKQMDFDSPVTFSFNHRSGDVIMPRIKWVEPLKTEIEHFVKCIQSGAQCLTNAEHACRVLKILSN